jgi:hypothetical protein
MHVDKVLRPLADFERLLAGLYTWLSQGFAADPEVATLFFQLAAEELAHADLIEFQRRLVRQNPNHFGEVAVDLGDIFATRAQVERAREQGSLTTIEAALHFAFKIESSAAEYHFRHVLLQANPDMAQLLDSLGKGDKQHLARIMEVAAARGIILSL